MNNLIRPIVALVGRPNVGKSTLFNKLVGKRRAIVQDQPGITRDRNEGRGRYSNRQFTVIDTGGLFPPGLEDVKGGGTLAEAVSFQTYIAIEQSDFIFFVMDGREGMLPLDEEVYRILLKSGKPIYYVVNKTEGNGIDRLTEFYRLGVAPLYPISSEHNQGLSELLDALYPHMAPLEEEEGEAAIETPRIAVLGRPNVGKSTLINTLLKEDRLIVSDIAGTTRDTIDTLVVNRNKHYLLIDTAGIRKRGKIGHGVEQYSVARAKEALDRSHISLLLLDGVGGITEQDTKIAGMVSEMGNGMILLINKSDLLDEAGQEKLRDQMNVRFPFIHDPQIEFISAKAMKGIGRTFKKIDAVYQGMQTRISTGDLNRFFEKVIEKRSPPVYKGRVTRLYYLTQVSVFPPTFVFFVSAPAGLPGHYLRYIENQFRENFNFTGAPIRIKLRQRR